MLSRSFTKVGRVSVILASSLLLLSCDRLLTPGFETSIAELRSGAYVLDKDHASLNFKINHLGFSTYVGRFNEFNASLDFDPENIGNSSLEVIIEVASLDVNNPEFAETLKGSGWFEVESFPQAIYRTNSCAETGEKTFTCQGDLTLHGVTAPMALDVTFNGGGRNFLTRKYTLGFAANATFQRSVFGVDQFVNFGVGDDIQLEIHVEFQQSEG
ncbi:MAG: hypothetical protein RLZZ385_2113 [Pseudomonadota bacterium]|jgi:polyisoprenoid-binding protein YceI